MNFEKSYVNICKLLRVGTFQKFYPTLEDAINSVKRGEIIGALHLSSNFSLATEERQRDGRDASDSSIENSNANYWLDMSSKYFNI